MKKMTFSFAFCLLIRTFVPPMEYALLVKGYRRRQIIHRNMKVLKFGGTSVGSVKSILSLKKIVETEARTQPVIVVAPSSPTTKNALTYSIKLINCSTS